MSQHQFMSDDAARAADELLLRMVARLRAWHRRIRPRDVLNGEGRSRFTPIHQRGTQVMFDKNAMEMIPVMLWDLQAQLEAQLRRCAAAQHHWTASQNGENIRALARMTAATDEMVVASEALRDATALLSDQLTDHP